MNRRIKLVIASNNDHKLQEIRDIVGDTMDLLRLIDIGCIEDIPETGDTLEENASQKSNYIFRKYGFNCFADDTGLEVDFLGGEPGVFSARYAGEDRSSSKNIQKLLSKLEGIEDRDAQFRCVISLIINETEHLFEGVVRGHISHTILGESGFGYDPIFIPLGYSQSFAQMSSELKNEISHRGIAVKKLINFLRTVD